MKLKIDIHLHTKDDPMDNTVIHYSNEQLIDYAAQLGFEVLAITNHDKITYNSYLKDYAQERGILLIPGVEATIEGKHVLLINYDGPLDFKSVGDLKRIKGSNTLILAAHPFFPSEFALKNKLPNHIEVFDAIEFCHFYRPWINFNKKAVESAHKNGKPLVGTSDAHHLFQMNHTYSWVETSQKTPDAVIEAIKEKHIEIVTAPLPWSIMLRVLRNFFLSSDLYKQISLRE